MRIKELPEDFVVEEVIDLPLKSDGKQTYVWVTKTNWTTDAAAREIAKRLGISQKRIKFAGTKDKRAVTKQVMSLFRVDENQLQNLEIKDIKVELLGEGDKATSIGTLVGNKFDIVIRDLSDEDVARMKERIKEISEKGFLNYFGEQRFGKGSTHLIGKEIILNHLEEAAKIILTFEGDTELKEKRDLRRQISDKWGEWDEIIEFPKGMSLERMIVEYLKDHPSDFAGALRQIPNHIRKLYVHAYQSFVWNEALRRCLGKDLPEDLPIPGCDTVLGNDSFSAEVKKILNDEGVSLEDFRCLSMPELGTEGDVRKSIVIPKDIRVLDEGEDEIYKNRKMTLAFELPKGVYATVLIDAITQ